MEDEGDFQQEQRWKKNLLESAGRSSQEEKELPHATRLEEPVTIEH